MTDIGTRELGSVGFHTVTATTTQLEVGVLYTQTECTCERKALIGGSAAAGEAWARGHLALIVESERR